MKSSSPWARSLKYICIGIETLHLSVSLPISISLPFFSGARIPTVYRSQSTLSPQAPVSYKSEYLYRSSFFWSIDHHFVQKGECILFDFMAIVKDESSRDLLHEDTHLACWWKLRYTFSLTHKSSFISHYTLQNNTIHVWYKQHVHSSDFTLPLGTSPFLYISIFYINCDIAL